jgi:hypothetical protein
MAAALNPPTQYADDGNLRARQRLSQNQHPYFDLVAWVLDCLPRGSWPHVVEAVRREVARVIRQHGEFVVRGDSGAFVGQ